MKTPMQNAIYFATQDGFINGVYRKKGETCGQMSPNQAKYYLLNGTISERKPEAAPAPELAPTTLDKKTR